MRLAPAHHFCSGCRLGHLAPTGPPAAAALTPAAVCVCVCVCCREIGFIVYALGKPLDPFLQKQYD